MAASGLATDDREAPMPDTIIYETFDQVARLTFNRPEALNSFTPEMESDIHRKLDAFNADPRLRVLILTGAGRAFSAGGSRPFRTAASAEPGQAPGDSARPASQDVRMPERASPHGRFLFEHVDKPVIAAVNGVAAGEGYALALVSDIRIGSTQARFAHPYLLRGIMPAAEVWWLPRIIGLGATLYHILMADFIDANEALRLGLLSKVVEPEALADEALTLAREIAKRAPITTRFTKRAIYQGLLQDYASCMNAVGWARAVAETSDESQEGVRAFMEKREPHFR
jgi:2-(1,2-epoxy-1,2-dihydrophenyl)acetyl-CoA isomerase